MSKNEEMAGTTRREFIRNAATTAAVTAAAANVAKSSVYSLAPGRVIGANEKIIIGHVGMGGQGMTHVTLLKQNATEGLTNNTAQVAVSDLYVRRNRKAMTELGLKESQMFADYRKLLEIKAIDAVWVTTSDQWHTDIACDAMEAGKHVYIEKPMCKTLEETFRLYDTAKKTGRIVQVGSQGTSDPKYHKCAELVKSGKYGKTVVLQGSYNRNSKDGEWEYPIDADAGPEAKGDGYIDWKTFRKNATDEWDADKFFRWRKWWEYGTGLVGDLFPHRLHPLYIAMGLPMGEFEGYPMRVSSGGGLYVQTKSPEGKLDRNVPDFINLICDFPGGPSLMLMSSSINEQGWADTIRMNQATLTVGQDTIDVKPERVYADVVDEDTVQVPGGEPIDRHERNFLDAIRGVVKTPNCNIDVAARVQTIISLGELAYRNSATMTFDPKTRTAKAGTVTVVDVNEKVVPPGAHRG